MMAMKERGRVKILIWAGKEWGEEKVRFKWREVGGGQKEKWLHKRISGEKEKEWKIDQEREVNYIEMGSIRKFYRGTGNLEC